jgi:hypothetical protein
LHYKVEKKDFKSKNFLIVYHNSSLNISEMVSSGVSLLLENHWKKLFGGLGCFPMAKQTQMMNPEGKPSNFGLTFLLM